MKKIILVLMISFISSVSYGEALAQLKECSFCTILYGPGHLQCDCDKKTQVTGKKRKVSSIAKAKKVPNCAKCIAAGKVRRYCKECGGSQICIHDRQKQLCKECGGSQICIHDKQKQHCKECGGSAYCTHRKEKKRCKTCKNPCSHADKLYKCKEGCYESWVQRKLRAGSAASAAI